MVAYTNRSKGGGRAEPYDSTALKQPKQGDVHRFCEKWRLDDETWHFLKDLPANIFDIIARDFSLPSDVKNPNHLCMSFAKRVHEAHTGRKIQNHSQSYVNPNGGRQQYTVSKTSHHQQHYHQADVPNRKTHGINRGGGDRSAHKGKELGPVGSDENIIGFAKKWAIGAEGIHKLQTLDPEVLKGVIADFNPKSQNPRVITSVLISFADGIARELQKETQTGCPVAAFVRTWKLSRRNAINLRSSNPNVQHFVFSYFGAEGCSPPDINRRFTEYLDDIAAITKDAIQHPTEYALANDENKPPVFDTDEFVAKYNLNGESVEMLRGMSDSVLFRVVRDFDPPATRPDMNPIFVAFAQSVKDRPSIPDLDNDE